MELISFSLLGRILRSLDLDRSAQRQSKSKEMSPICYKCGVTGYTELLLRCRKCKASVEHIYCLAEFPIVKKGGWICQPCKPTSSNITNDDLELNEQQRYYSDSNLRTRTKKQKASRGKSVPYSEQEKIESEVTSYRSPDEGEDRKSKRRKLILADEDSLDHELQPNHYHSLTKKSIELPSDEVTIGYWLLEHEISTSEATLQEKVQDDHVDHALNKEVTVLPSAQILPSPLHAVSCGEVTIGSHIVAQETSTSEALVQEKVQDHSLTKKATILPSEQKLASSLHTVSSDEVKIGSRIVTPETSTCETMQEKIQNDQSNEHIYSTAQPIAGHIWRGYISFGDEKYYGPLTAYLSSLACERVYYAAKLLPSVLHMEKLSRVEFCPNSFKNSPPTDNTIGLYFLPEGKMIETVYDQLVNDAIQKDLLFNCILDGVELLVFSSTILPKHNHRFLGKHYLWGAFRRRHASLSTLAVDIRPKPSETKEEIQRMKVSKHSRDKEKCSKPSEAREEFKGWRYLPSFQVIRKVI